MIKKYRNTLDKQPLKGIIQLFLYNINRKFGWSSRKSLSFPHIHPQLNR